ATGSRVSPLYVTALAKAYAATGRVEEGVSLVEQALATSHELSAHINEPELQGLKGEILLVQASTKDAEEAERCFRTAIELAQRIGSKSIELRTTTSLARLHLKKGKRDEPRAMLADIYSWF